MDILIGDIAIKVSGWFREFCGDCVFIIFKKLELNSTEIEIPEPPSIDDVKLPYFVKGAE